MSDLDEGKLADWLATVLPYGGSPLLIDKFAGGQSNPTYKVTQGRRVMVLRRKPFGTLLPSAHAIEREYRLIAALHSTGFPVPRAIALCEDASVIGAPFYLMTMVEGRNLWEGALPDTPRNERRAHYEAMIDTLAALHTLNPQALGLGDFGRPGNYFARQIERWTSQYRSAQTEDIAEAEHLIEWLPATLPAQDRTSIIHGDYRIDNLIFASGAPEVAAVLDWELATIGDPLADFAYLAMNWIMPADGRSGLAGIDLAAAGLPTLDGAIARYCAATGREGLPDLHWYFAYNLFRLTAIVQGIKKRLIEGNASNAQAEVTVARLVPLAQAAWVQARLAGAIA